MTRDDRYASAGHSQYKLFGVYVSPDVFDALAEFLYDEAGVVDYGEYFDPSKSTVLMGDPGADATDALVSSLVADFADLYDEADFEDARRVDADAFVLAHLAAGPQTVASARERFQAAATIQDSDLRTVHTAILSVVLSTPNTTDER